jgi:hypothetical protein
MASKNPFLKKEIHILWPLIEAHLVCVASCRNQQMREQTMKVLNKIITSACIFFMEKKIQPVQLVQTAQPIPPIQPPQTPME